MFALVLAALTWRSNRTAQRVADEARKGSLEERQWAREQTERAAMPAITFRDARFRDSTERIIEIAVVNVGFGPAVALTIFPNDPHTADLSAPIGIRYRVHDRDVNALMAGERMKLTLERVTSNGVTGQPHLFVLEALFRSVYGNHGTASRSVRVDPGRGVDLGMALIPDVRAIGPPYEPR
jgi:hypothetical protein